jgi:hypothetical protein
LLICFETLLNSDWLLRWNELSVKIWRSPTAAIGTILGDHLHSRVGCGKAGRVRSRQPQAVPLFLLADSMRYSVLGSY